MAGLKPWGCAADFQDTWVCESECPDQKSRDGWEEAGPQPKLPPSPSAPSRACSAPRSRPELGSLIYLLPLALASLRRHLPFHLLLGKALEAAPL